MASLGYMETLIPNTPILYVDDSDIQTLYDPGTLSLLRTMSFVPVLESIKLIPTLVTRVSLAVGHGGHIH